MCWNTASSSSERKRIRRDVLPGSDSLPVSDKLTKAIVPDGIIAQQKEMRKIGAVNFLFTVGFLCDKIKEKW